MSSDQSTGNAPQLDYSAIKEQKNNSGKTKAMSNKPSEKDLRQYTLFKVWQPLQNVEERDQKLVRDIVFGPQQRRDPTQSIATIKVLKDDDQRRIHSLCLDGYNLHTPSMSKIGDMVSVQQMYTEIGWSRVDTEQIFGH